MTKALSALVHLFMRSVCRFCILRTNIFLETNFRIAANSRSVVLWIYWFSFRLKKTKISIRG